jgi:hypothetical protein
VSRGLNWSRDTRHPRSSNASATDAASIGFDRSTSKEPNWSFACKRCLAKLVAHSFCISPWIPCKVNHLTRTLTRDCCDNERDLGKLSGFSGSRSPR